MSHCGWTSIGSPGEGQVGDLEMNVESDGKSETYRAPESDSKSETYRAPLVEDIHRFPPPRSC